MWGVAMELMKDSSFTVWLYSGSFVVREGLRVILEGSGWKVVSGLDLSLGRGVSVIIVDLTARSATDTGVQSVVSEYRGAARILCFMDRPDAGESEVFHGLNTIYSFSTPEEIANAVAGPRKVSRRAVLSKSLRLASIGSGQRLVDALSRREREVFRLLGYGFWNCRIAKELGISVKTVETHKENLKRKLNLQSARELTRCAIECYQK